MSTSTSRSATGDGNMYRLAELARRTEPDETEAEVEEEDVSVLMYTSGTTSLPKGVMLQLSRFHRVRHRQCRDGGRHRSRGGAGVRAVLPYRRNHRDDDQHLDRPQNYRDAAVRREDLAQAGGEEKVTHAFVVPTMMKQLLDEPGLRQDTDFSNLTNLAYGGAAMPIAVIRRAIEAFPKTVGFVNAYGQTETTSSLTVLGPDDHRIEGTPSRSRAQAQAAQLDRQAAARRRDQGPRRRRQVPWRTARLARFVIRTPRIMKGYAGREDDSALPDGWRATGDLGWVDDEGYVFFAGRKDDMIIRGGENIAPAEIETVLMSHPAIDEAAVIGVPSVEWGQVVKAFVVQRPGEKVSDKD